ncbi:uncharacterized protein M6B38_347905 [Iris pallida]|uniref:O-fucosyltransferase family protein n=1 Tax=Iris pallida TaxID=29817 RepID=A0AAX6GTR9_IRIPA|nr:uncharacterized protein M6B38_347905 [Iris pallida]
MSNSGEELPSSPTIEIQLQTPRSRREEEEGWSSSNNHSRSRSRSRSTTPRSRNNSPRLLSDLSSRSAGTSCGSLWGSWASAAAGSVSGSFRLRQQQRRRPGGRRRRRWRRGMGILVGVVGFFLVVNWWMFSRLQDPNFGVKKSRDSESIATNATSIEKEEWTNDGKGQKTYGIMYTRLLALAAHALAEADSKPEPPTLWQEPPTPMSTWTPCADQRSWKTCEGKNGYIIVSANGGINQQRVAICNAVAIARLLNSTLVIPKFLHSSVWQDRSQFSDIYQEEHFVSYLKDDIQIVKELPVELQSLDLEAIGSLITDAEVMKEAKPSFYMKKILPILLKNRVVHFTGFGNRLASDPIPDELQRLRCRCNFHALRFVDKIQRVGALLVQRMRHNRSRGDSLEHNLLGPFAVESKKNRGKHSRSKVSRYLAVHLRFEIDMAAYSMCYFGGGKEEKEELDAYRAVHFPALTNVKKTMKIPSAAFLRSEGRCPLTPEESVLMLAALGFNRKTRIYIAGADIYGGKSRMAALKSLYPNLATKENLLTSSEIEPFQNFSSQLAALDFIVCTAADAFAMTDSGSQFSSLVSGYRMYYGGGKYPTIRPNKRRLVSVFSRNSTIEWKDFEHSVRKAVRQDRRVEDRPLSRSIYRHPRSMECMCLKVE